MNIRGRLRDYLGLVDNKLGEVDLDYRKSLLEKAEMNALKHRAREKEIAVKQRELNLTKDRIKFLEDQIFNEDAKHQRKWEGRIAKAEANVNKYKGSKNILGKVAHKWYEFRKNQVEDEASLDYKNQVSPSIEIKRERLKRELEEKTRHENSIKYQKEEMRKLGGSLDILSKYDADRRMLRNYKLGGAIIGGIGGAVGGHHLGDNLTRDMDPEEYSGKIRAIKSLTTLGGGLIGAGGGMYAGKFAHEITS